MNRAGRFAGYVFLTAVLEVINILFHLAVGIVPLIIYGWLPWPIHGFLHPILESIIWDTAFIFFVVVIIGEVFHLISERRYRALVEAANES